VAVAAPKFIDHVVVEVRDLAASRAFYEAALRPLGARVTEFDDGSAVAFGPPASEDLVLVAGEPGKPLHVALAAPDRPAVDAFHAAALGAGGRDNGGPGLRPHYHEHYYAAFVLDPDGNNVEAVCHAPAPGGAALQARPS
jgi:catechol 2,3-dioxygenase-like lactoylglutathione lyase family enzyme